MKTNKDTSHIIHFTNSTIGALPFTDKNEKRKRYKDTKQRGFFLIVSANNKTFYLEKKINNKAVKVKIGHFGEMTIDQARDKFYIAAGEISTGRNPNAEKKAAKARSEVTLQYAFDAYLEFRKGKLAKQTVYEYTRAIDGPLSDWKNKPIVAISRNMVSNRHTKLTEKGGRKLKSGVQESGKAYANNIMRYLHAILKFAQGKFENEAGESLLVSNPVDKITQLRQWHSIPRRQTIIPFNKLGVWYSGVREMKKRVVADYLVFTMFNGLRRRESASLAWAAVHFDTKLFTIFETKNKRQLVLPMSDFIFKLLARRYAERVPNAVYVFPGKFPGTHLKDIRRVTEKLIEHTGISHTIHDLRRVFSSNASGLVTGYELKTFLNHKNTADVTAGYIVNEVERLRPAMEKISRRLLSLCQASPGGKIITLPTARVSNE